MQEGAENMTKRAEIIAIREFFDLDMQEAAERHRTIERKELDNIIEWFLDKQEEEKES